MGEPTGNKRQVKPWVAFVAITAVVLLGVAWLAVNQLGAGGALRARRGATAPHGPEWNRANNLCRRLNMAGNTYAVYGLYDSALACYREALRIAKKHGIIERMAASYHDLSGIFDYKQMPESARFYLDAATALDRTTGSKNKTASSLLEEGTFRFKSMGDIDSGKALLEEALRQSRVLGNRWIEVAALHNLGSMQAFLEHYDSARVLFESCAALGRVLKDKSSEAAALHSIAHICLRRDRLDETKSWLLRTIEAAHAGGLIGEEASALYDLAMVRAEQDDYGLAQVNVEQAMKLYQLANDTDGIRRSRGFLDALIQVQRWKDRTDGIDSIIEQDRKERVRNPGA
jgi:tetratricopeptide (TPR) repeat protein